ncbi:uncharacterized protein LTR77_001950 [Saxophila tyrrhenica]|uniref:Uncharacterized protein n=1 Tax=Saxophila tyrrhenica TaxID=1690608 RepID=A0AAV9PHP4_9PEZI|nr:hypothetical protein LTR77_001950 [Saxophila tyrrhenica]
MFRHCIDDICLGFRGHLSKAFLLDAYCLYNTLMVRTRFMVEDFPHPRTHHVTTSLASPIFEEKTDIEKHLTHLTLRIVLPGYIKGALQASVAGDALLKQLDEGWLEEQRHGAIQLVQNAIRKRGDGLTFLLVHDNVASRKMELLKKDTGVV